MEQVSPGGIFAGMSFPYVNKWWKVKDDENVLLIHYADAKADLSGKFLLFVVSKNSKNNLTNIDLHLDQVLIFIFSHNTIQQGPCLNLQTFMAWS